MKPDVIVVTFGETGDEPYVIRGLIESYGGTVLLKTVGKASDFLKAVNEADSKYLVLSIHGVAKGIVLPNLAKEVEGKESYKKVVTSKDLSKELSLNSEIVLSTGCATGGKDMAKSFLEAGAKQYIAPDGYPEGNSIPLFLSVFFYRTFALDELVTSAFEAAKGQNKETVLFSIHS